MKEKIEDKAIIASSLVKMELDYQQDELTQFINQFTTFFVQPDRSSQRYVNYLINHPNFDKWGKNEAHQADPFVVALAKIKKLSAVSYENPRKTKNSIPAACKELEVQHLTFVEFLREELFSQFK